MHKGTVLFFFLTLALAGHTQSYSAADSVLSGGDTLSATYGLAGMTVGDTVYFGMASEEKGHKDLERFFNKNLRAPEPGDSASIPGIARVYFVIDKTGRVTQAWYNSGDNVNIGLEALHVVNLLPVLRPSSIRGEAVITKVCIIVAVKRDGQAYTGTLSPDLTITVSPPAN